MIGTPIENLTVSQIKEELRTFYGIRDFSDVVELKDLQAKLTTTRNSQLITHGLQYGPLLQVGNRKNPNGVVTFLHGLGDSAHGWEPVAHELAGSLPHLLFLLPTAPVRPVTINGGMSMNAWYDIKEISAATDVSRQDGETVMISADYVKSLAYTTTQRYCIPKNRVVYAGFSQGAAVSLAAGITSRIAPAGVAVLSGYLAGGNVVLSRLCNKESPILMCHGTEDGIVPFEAAQQTKKALEAAGVASITLKSYRMEHSSHPDEIRDLVSFLKKVLPAIESKA
ncbi:putative lysophospholipase [Trypanosoma cruzi]|uniref:Lysophospholipase, putative n=2 Tax=Trypanosoma cruzi TaxID=5693 RepID=Q4DA08_TRYCC|nr:lysophospholipase, putative [Trypanosoma cruzi]EAN89361.1 lysophospholipase, putative [Trypanosoma cruzi]KAF8297209.1 putative lysophospholipase [Trypanosoma cruzi]PWV18980.1 putative lysophospholipase [Trypanosoma cruzi]RNC59423.1 lysophospholipase [Trypanosoma cruzi]|eukprot:XP_811212.1 lysophospholipase [Trypanosoma cruzi strain CL Brener]